MHDEKHTFFENQRGIAEDESARRNARLVLCDSQRFFLAFFLWE